MTAIQLNAEILRNMSIIAEDENLLKRARGPCSSSSLEPSAKL
jgi:hypothetical protein